MIKSLVNTCSKRLYSSSFGNHFIFIGAPGVGKGTYASRLSPMLNVPQISTGDIVREQIRADSSMGRLLKQYANEGKLVPDEVIINLLKERLKASDAQNGYILDGFPRTVAQAEELNSFAIISRVVNFTIPESVLLRKLMGRRVCGSCHKTYNIAHIKEAGMDMPALLPTEEDVHKCAGCAVEKLTTRPDDQEHVIRERMMAYKNQSEPVIGYYQKANLLLEFSVQKGLADLPRLMEDMRIMAVK